MLELYEKYRLKDGRTGRAVEILGGGAACIFELDKKDWRTGCSRLPWRK